VCSSTKALTPSNLLKNHLLAILATKNFSEPCKSSSAKSFFLTKAANFSVTKFQQWVDLIPCFQFFISNLGGWVSLAGLT
jgi:hypothetical protein